MQPDLTNIGDGILFDDRFEWAI